MNISCFIAPIHPPKFNYALTLIKSYNKFFDDDHFFFIFSTEEDEYIFRELAVGLKYSSIIYTGDVTDGIITLKKFYGLNWIFSKTNFKNVAVIDVDCVFTRYMNYDELFSKYNDNITLYFTQGTAWYCCNIVRSPLKFFNDEDINKLNDIIDNSLYFWFNDIPIYDKNKFTEFMEYINYKNIYKNIAHTDFDFIIYGYFLLIKRYAEGKCFNIQTEFGFLENQDIIPQNIFSEIFHTYEPMWIKYPIENMVNAFLLLHTDRINTI